MSKNRIVSIPLGSIEFTRDGSAKISDEAVLKVLKYRLESASEGRLELKNVGCCSAAAVREALAPEELKNVGCCSRVAAEIARNVSAVVEVGDELKNVGCCSAAADFEKSLKNVGCCSAPAELQETLKNVGCCSASMTEIDEALKNVGCCSAVEHSREVTSR